MPAVNLRTSNPKTFSWLGQREELLKLGFRCTTQSGWIWVKRTSHFRAVTLRLRVNDLFVKKKKKKKKMQYVCRCTKRWLMNQRIHEDRREKKWVYTYFRIKICLVLIYFNRSASPDLIPPPSQASFLIHVDGNEHSWASSLRRQD